MISFYGNIPWCSCYEVRELGMDESGEAEVSLFGDRYRMIRIKLHEGETYKMSKKDNCQKKSDKPKNEIYILQSTYKQGDPEMVGAYDSMRAMMRGFAKSIADEILGYPEKGGVEQKIAHEVARTLADLIPAFFDHDYPRDGEGYIRYGKTTYGYNTMHVEGVDENVDGQNEDASSEGDEETKITEHGCANG